MGKIGFGIIGCGTVSDYGHIPALAGNKNIELIALSDLDNTKLRKYKDKYGIKRTFTNYKELLQLKEIKAITVATHLDSRHDIIIDAAEAGKHVLSEKPFARNLQEGKEMISAMSRARKILAVNLGFRVGYVERRVKEEIEKGTIGKIKVIRHIYIWHHHQWTDKKRLDNFMRNGGPIVDSGVHFFDLCRWFSNSEFKIIEGVGAFVPEYDNPVHVIASGNMENGIVWLIETSWIYGHRTKDKTSHSRLDVIGNRGLISHANGEFRISTDTDTILEKVTSSDKGFEQVYEGFIKSIHQGKLQILASGEDALKASLSAFQALASAKQKTERIVTWRTSMRIRKK